MSAPYVGSSIDVDDSGRDSESSATIIILCSSAGSALQVPCKACSQRTE